MIFSLPQSVEIQGVEYSIRSDYRDVLNICIALDDQELDGQEKALVILDTFYPEFEEMPTGHYQDAIEKCFWFINCGDDTPQDRKSPKLVDWEHDFHYIVAPINRVCGQEIRSIPYMHWWTFISCYYEIGSECVFSQIVNIRSKLARGEKLDKGERKWYQKNRNMVDIKTKFTNEEQELMREWGCST